MELIKCQTASASGSSYIIDILPYICICPYTYMNFIFHDFSPVLILVQLFTSTLQLSKKILPAMHTDTCAHSVSQFTLRIRDDGLRNKERGREQYPFPTQLLRNDSYQWKASRQNGRKENKVKGDSFFNQVYTSKGYLVPQKRYQITLKWMSLGKAFNLLILRQKSYCKCIILGLVFLSPNELS